MRPRGRMQWMRFLNSSADRVRALGFALDRIESGIACAGTSSILPTAGRTHALSIPQKHHKW